MIVINENTLCRFCRKLYYLEETEPCYKKYCEISKRMYLEVVGITETPEPQEAKTFRNISTNDKIYVVTENQIIPKIKESNILSVFKLIDGSLSIDSDTGRINISPENMDKSKTLISFLLKSDCKKRLDDICTARIATLQKVIDTK